MNKKKPIKNHVLHKYGEKQDSENIIFTYIHFCILYCPVDLAYSMFF